jgi:hypothetical protein
MSPGSRVVYLERPDWGIGIVEFVAPNGLLTVSFEVRGRPFSSDFGPFELEMAERAQAAA